MGSYETVIKLKEVKRRVEEGDLLSAQKVLDTIEIKRIKKMSDLSLIAEVYAQNERLEEAADLYLRIFEKLKTRKALYQLIEVLIKLNNIDDAEYFLELYQKLAPRDPQIYIFRFKIVKMKGESFENQIEVLEELKNTEYTEKWAYELAKLYYKAGMEAECIRECSDLELWFGEGIYVEKAKILRSTYSGETDKERIMEEIRRRAEAVHRGDTGRLFTESATSYDEVQTEDEQYSPELAEENEEFPESVYIIHEDTVEFEVDLSKDVRNIMTDENTEDTSFYSGSDETIYSKETTYYEVEQISEGENQTYDLIPEYEDQIYEHSSENNEIFEQASEDYDQPFAKESEDQNQTNLEEATYVPEEQEEPISNEEDSIFDEEDRILSQFEEELQINMEEIFGDFLRIVSVKRQIVKSIDTVINDRSRNLMLIITGSEGSEKATLAKCMAMFLYKAGKLNSSKLAKIAADKLNTIDILAKKEVLKDCCLIVESASDLKRTTIDGLMELSQQLHGDLAIVFEEDKKNMNKLFREYPKLMDLLKNRIHL